MTIRLFDLAECLSGSLDLISPAVVGHHSRVGALAARLGHAAGLENQQIADLGLAGMLHDVGAFALKDRLDALSFDSSDTSHPETGFRLLRCYPGFQAAAEMVQAHHTPWSWMRTSYGPPGTGKALGNLVYLVDRVDTLLPRDPGHPLDPEGIVERIRSGRGKMFNPEWVDAFEELAASPGFWEEMAAPPAKCARWGIAPECNPVLSFGEVSTLSRVFSQIIDFRCRFTATHSRGVTAITVALGQELGMTQDDLEQLEVAGQLHDLGKLAVPAEIILKPGALDSGEMATMRLHAEHGCNALSGVPGLSDVARWVGQHHERLDGKGYPGSIGASQIDLASRVLAVADIFTALAEDRPYRRGMDLGQITSIIGQSGAEGALDHDVTSTLLGRCRDYDGLRLEAQSQALRDFQRFAAGIAPHA